MEQVAQGLATRLSPRTPGKALGTSVRTCAVHAPVLPSAVSEISSMRREGIPPARPRQGGGAASVQSASAGGSATITPEARSTVGTASWVKARSVEAPWLRTAATRPAARRRDRAPRVRSGRRGSTRPPADPAGGCDRREAACCEVRLPPPCLRFRRAWPRVRPWWTCLKGSPRTSGRRPRSRASR